MERETLEVLSFVLSMKNTFAPINRIPPEALSLIPDHWGHQAEKDLIRLTHVCHGWREIFASCSSLWTHLDCKNTEKTRVYIERSRSHPLEISLKKLKSTSYSNDALLMAAPHTNRLGSLTIHIHSNALSSVLSHFPFPAPLLKELQIVILDLNNPILDPATLNAIFSDHLSPLRKLSLCGVVTDIPWRNLSNLTVFELHPARRTLVDSLFVGKLLDFFESVPLLRKIELCNSIPDSPAVFPGRVIPLLALENLAINKFPAHSAFLDHLSIPRCALFKLRFSFSRDSHPIPFCFVNFGNLNTTTINLLVYTARWTRMRLSGPGGVLRLSGTVYRWSAPSLLESLGKSDLSKARRLSVTAYPFQSDYKIEDTLVFHTLLPMNDLRILALIEVCDLPFIRALNPEENKSRTVLCPELEDLVIYAISQDNLYLEQLKDMARNRAMRFSKLSSITIIDLSEGYQHHKRAIFSLKEYVWRVEYKSEVSPPDWDAVFGDRGDDENETPSQHMMHDDGGDD